MSLGEGLFNRVREDEAVWQAELDLIRVWDIMANGKGNFRLPFVIGKLIVQSQQLESHLAPPVCLSLRFL